MPSIKTQGNSPLTIALAGNPNSGKTTVFNGLTGSNQRIGNWPGVTVERKEGLYTHHSLEELLTRPFTRTSRRSATMEGGEELHRTVRVIDLPGIYSLSASSEDEAVARDYLLQGEADLVVNIVDASNIQRNLYLTLQLLEMGVPVLVVLNMMDMAEKRGISIDAKHLSEHLGCPVIASSSIKKDGIEDIRHAIAEIGQSISASRVTINYPDPMERVIGELAEVAASLKVHISAGARWVALKLLEGDPWIEEQILDHSELTPGKLDSIRSDLKDELQEDLDVVIADSKYGFIHGLSAHVTRKKLTRQSITERLDSVVMNRWAALPIFLLVMYSVFWVTMSIGGAFIDFFDILFGTIFVEGTSALLTAIGAPPWLDALLARGVGSGLQTVATFVPIIFFMFFMLSILEDSGYMARAAFVVDRFMRGIGLPGKSFVPMMVGFGCTVPAIMGTRTLESKRDRFMTIFMSPNMSCGARLPVYALFAVAFFPTHSGFIVFSLYMVGIIIAVVTGMVLKLTMFKGEPSHFVMELPAYHAPRLRFVGYQAWFRLKTFIVRAGSTIVLIVTILAILNTFALDGTIGHDDQDDSILSDIARFISPVFTPMGIEKDNWPATVGIFTGVFAKEAVVGTLNSLYSQLGGSTRTADAAADEVQPGYGKVLGDGTLAALSSIGINLATAFHGILDPLGLSVLKGDQATVVSESGASKAILTGMRRFFDKSSAYAYLLFILIYVPCVAAMGAAIREMGPKLGAILAIYNTTLAWSVASLFYQISSGGAAVNYIIPGALLILIYIGLALIGKIGLREMKGEPGGQQRGKFYDNYRA